MLETHNYTRKPSDVEAVRVTKANMEEVASWSKGEIFPAGKAKFILVPVHNPQNDRQTKAFIGDFVVFDGRGFKVYMPKAFAANFNRNGDATNLRPTSLDHPDVALEILAVSGEVAERLIDTSKADELQKVVAESRPGVIKKVTPAPVPRAKDGRQHAYLQPSVVEPSSHPGDMPGVSEEGYVGPVDGLDEVQEAEDNGVFKTRYVAPSPDQVE